MRDGTMMVALSRLLERRYFYWVPKMPQGDGQRAVGRIIFMAIN